MTLRAAVVGCGFIGAGDVVPGAGIQSHAAAWTHHPETRLVGLTDIDSARLATATARWRGAAAFRDVGQMLAATKPDVVSICTPDETHTSLLEQVLGCSSVQAVLAEKPLALDVREARRIVTLARERGVVLAVNYGRRSAPSHQALRRWLADEPVGPIEVVRGSYVRGLKHNGTHWLDLARFLIGEIATIRGRGAIAGNAVDATIDLELEFVGGARGAVVGLRSSTFSLFEMDLIGAAGRVRICDGGQRVEAFGAIASRWFAGFRELAPMACPPGGLSDLVLHAATDLIEALATGRPPACTGDDATVALALAADALVSAEEGSHATISC